MWNFIDQSEIIQTKSRLLNPIFLCHRQETPSISMNWRNRENDGVYISLLTLRRLEIWHDSSKYILTITRHGSRFYVSHSFERVGSVLSKPKLHVDPIRFYLVLCTFRVRT